jgi:hypothetical protein
LLTLTPPALVLHQDKFFAHAYGSGGRTAEHIVGRTRQRQTTIAYLISSRDFGMVSMVCLLVSSTMTCTSIIYTYTCHRKFAMLFLD